MTPALWASAWDTGGSGCLPAEQPALLPLTPVRTFSLALPGRTASRAAPSQQCRAGSHLGIPSDLAAPQSDP